MTGQPVRYFISYVFSNYQGTGNGWAEITCPQPIGGGRDVVALTEKLMTDNNVTALTILGWQRFEDEVSP